MQMIWVVVQSDGNNFDTCNTEIEYASEYWNESAVWAQIKQNQEKKNDLGISGIIRKQKQCGEVLGKKKEFLMSDGGTT